MNSLDSWIDLTEIADLVNQLMPDDSNSGANLSLMADPEAESDRKPAPSTPFEPVSPPPQNFFADPTPPAPLIPAIPPEWGMSEPTDHAPGAFPSLDDLAVPDPKPIPIVAQAPAPPEPAAPMAQVQRVPMPEPVEQPNAIFTETAATPLTEDDLHRAAEALTIDPGAREKILGTLAEIREMAGDFLGPESESPESPSSPAAPAIPAVPAIQPVSTEPAPAPLVTVADTQSRALFLPQGTLSTRIKVFADWVRGITGCSQLMISDPQGYSLLPAESDEDAPLVSSALQLMNVLSHARKKMSDDAPNSGVYLPIADNRWLGVLDCESGDQRICVSMVTEAPLSAAAADELTAGLKRVLEGAA
ncbi:MAG: hypothetical protein ACI8UO_003594 [Verrucomicrobiales bacterium]|jgi:hypothetical protein